MTPLTPFGRRAWPALFRQFHSHRSSKTLARVGWCGAEPGAYHRARPAVHRGLARLPQSGFQLSFFHHSSHEFFGGANDRTNKPNLSAGRFDVADGNRVVDVPAIVNRKSTFQRAAMATCKASTRARAGMAPEAMMARSMRRTSSSMASSAHSDPRHWSRVLLAARLPNSPRRTQ